MFHLWQSNADYSIVLKNGWNERELETKIIAVALRTNRFIGFTKTREPANPWTLCEYGDFEYYNSTEHCCSCDGKGYTEKYVGKRDCRKPYK